MLDLFRVEAESQVQVLTAGLLALEREPTAAAQLEACMRAAHSLKGAARIVDLSACVGVAHAMEDLFVAAQKGTLTLNQGLVDLLLRGVDLLARISQTPESQVAEWTGERAGEIRQFLDALKAGLEGGPVVGAAPPSAPEPPAGVVPAAEPAADSADRVLRVTAENLNRLLALAGQSLVESRWLRPFAESLLRLKRMHYELGRSLDLLRDALPPTAGEALHGAHSVAQRRALDCLQFLSERLPELEIYDRRAANLSHQLYDEALACRMRPFADGIHGLPRMVRDIGRQLGKQVRLEIVGETTEVDRDILDKLEAPLTHLLRNAIDHGIEPPEQRIASDKSAEGLIRLEARHSAGMLQITVADDGQGIDLDRLRGKVVERKLTTAEIAHRLSEQELLEFLFLPGFSLKGAVTEISGRGVGLDAVQDMVKGVRGTARIATQHGHGTRFTLQLPLTLSVVRTLIVDIAGEAYALPLAYIVRTLKLPQDRIAMLEGRQHFELDGRHIGLAVAHQVLNRGEPEAGADELCVVVVGDAQATYGLVVDRFRGERELVVQPLDPRLGKIKDIAAGALMDDGAPVLIVDVDDLVRSINKLVSTGHLNQVGRATVSSLGGQRKRVLVVDDSLTVRELERKLLGSRGYEVEIAVDGMDGWNAVRTGHFNLVVTDVDMPRMDGIELVSLIRKDPHLKSLPIMIVSYKDRPEDRQRGLDAGADYYLTKGSFHDETLLQSVVDLIGDPEAANQT